MSDTNSTVPEGFRQIPGFSRYAVDENGTVLSIRAGGERRNNRNWENAKRLAPSTDKLGYRRVCLRHDGRTQTLTVHALVLTTFVGPRPDGMQCRHLDGNPSNNHISNLAWGTPRENDRDKILHGTDSRGEQNGSAKLNATNILEIRMRAANGETQKSIAKDFHVRQTHISAIVLRRLWKHI